MLKAVRPGQGSDISLSSSTGLAVDTLPCSHTDRKENAILCGTPTIAAGMAVGGTALIADLGAGSKTGLGGDVHGETVAKTSCGVHV